MRRTARLLGDTTKRLRAAGLQAGRFEVLSGTALPWPGPIMLWMGTLVYAAIAVRAPKPSDVSHMLAAASILSAPVVLGFCGHGLFHAWPWFRRRLTKRGEEHLARARHLYVEEGCTDRTTPRRGGT